MSVIPVVCNHCKFHFEYPFSGVQPSLVCPVCGMDRTHEPEIHSVSPSQASNSVKSRQRDWKVLFLTVCCQFAILVIGISLISVSLLKNSDKHILADNNVNIEKELISSTSSPKVSMQLTSLSRPEPSPSPKIEEKKPEPPPSPKIEEKKPEPPPPPKTEEKKPEPPSPPKIEEKKPEPPQPPEPQPPNPLSRSPNLPTPEDRLRQAMLTLAEARMIGATDGAKSLQLTLRSIQEFKDVNQPIPTEAYWILGQSFAMQSWGDALLEGCPPIENLSASADGQWLLTGGTDRLVRILDFVRTQKGGEGFKLDMVAAPLVAVFFAPDLRLVVGGTIEGRICLWNMTVRNPAEEMIVFPQIVPGLRDLRISPDGRWLVAYGGPSNSSLANVKRNREADPLTNSLRRTLTDDIVLVGYQDTVGLVENGANVPLRHDVNALWLWDLKAFQGATPPMPIVLRGHEKPIRTMTISADSRWLVTGGEDTTVRIFDLKSQFPGSEQTVLKGHRLDVTALAIEPNNAWIASGSHDNTIRIWKFSNTFSAAGSMTLEGHLGWISSLVVNDTGERLISGSFDKTIRIWTLPKGQPDRPIAPPTIIYGDQGAVRKLAITADGKKLISLGVDSSLRIRSLEGTLESEHSLIIRNRTLPISKFTVTSDDRWLIFNYDNLGNLTDSGVRAWPLRLDDLLKSAQSEVNP